ncbi:hypothetical protein N7468_007452 [Penicillium chermesinum]|uniref:Uncharacterized protein n=1 Tax=Penicillium chermesinum TaxID=63820 RepID=A0A9W9NU39_9EURO|nr:uncharacterized protein N7468_007452 [Penicillium chermesinum]KAJ5226227.1 hypothetical protein N7468_007452 [Penicillium chermesinum]KAJ6160588.1 hypothetical protein N7470_003984 [Penicillium chermesinum]
MSATNRTLTHNPRIPPNASSDDDDPTSSSGSSDSESEESSEDEDEDTYQERSAEGASSTQRPSIPSITGRRKPRITAPNVNSDLMARLSAFLPQIQSANEQLEKEIAEGHGQNLVLDNADEGSDYIEMNLGLGVLEEKSGDGQNSDGADKNAQLDGDSNEIPANQANRSSEQDSDILSHLMGGKDHDEDMVKPSIEEV